MFFQRNQGQKQEIKARSNDLGVYKLTVVVRTLSLGYCQSLYQGHHEGLYFSNVSLTYKRRWLQACFTLWALLFCECCKVRHGIFYIIQFFCYSYCIKGFIIWCREIFFERISLSRIKNKYIKKCTVSYICIDLTYLLHVSLEILIIAYKLIIINTYISLPVY